MQPRSATRPAIRRWNRRSHPLPPRRWRRRLPPIASAKGAARWLLCAEQMRHHASKHRSRPTGTAEIRRHGETDRSVPVPLAAESMVIKLEPVVAVHEQFAGMLIPKLPLPPVIGKPSPAAMVSTPVVTSAGSSPRTDRPAFAPVSSTAYSFHRPLGASRTQPACCRSAARGPVRERIARFEIRGFEGAGSSGPLSGNYVAAASSRSDSTADLSSAAYVRQQRHIPAIRRISIRSTSSGDVTEIRQRYGYL